MGIVIYLQFKLLLFFLLRQKKLEVAMEEEGLADEEVKSAVITVTVVNNTVLCT